MPQTRKTLLVLEFQVCEAIMFFSKDLEAVQTRMFPKFADILLVNQTEMRGSIS